MKTSVLPLLLVLLLAVPYAGAAPTVGFDDLTLTIRDGTQKIRVENALDQVPIKHVAYAAARRDADYYLVLGLKEWTCGGGKEEFICWLHVRDGKVVERQSGLYNSCYEERTGSVLGWKDGVLLWRAEGRRRSDHSGGVEYLPTDFAWPFDSNHPEAGITAHVTDTSAH